MREELRKYGNEAYEMVEYAANEIGSAPARLGKREEVSRLSFADKLREIGLKPVTEKFVFAPHSSIGGLPYAGWAGHYRGAFSRWSQP